MPVTNASASTDCRTALFAPIFTRRPISTWPATPLCPPTITSSPIVVLPATPDCAGAHGCADSNDDQRTDRDVCAERRIARDVTRRIDAGHGRHRPGKERHGAREGGVRIFCAENGASRRHAIAVDVAQNDT